MLARHDGRNCLLDPLARRLIASMGRLPLARFKVVDLSRVRAGPTCVRQLADWGADVIKVEDPRDDSDLGGDRHGPDFQNIHRNKRSITLDLKKPAGVVILKKLAARSDVLVENFRPEVKFRLKVDYESLRAVNPRLVYASVSGFGQDGPYRERPGLDQIAQGMGGLMGITGLPGQGPVRAGIPVADLSAGLFAAMGVLIALLEREESGEGQYVETSLLAAQIAMLDFQAARWLINGEVAGQAGNNHPTAIPTGVFPTRDGSINIATAGEELWQRLADVLGLSALKAHPDFATAAARRANRDRLNALIAGLTPSKSSAEWVDLLTKACVPAGPIYEMNEVFADPQVKHLKMARKVKSKRLGEINLLSQAVSLSRTNWALRSASPERGEHTKEVLRELGYRDREITRLRKNGVI
jgi:crotonobetainyl-CoA:carnitine CoA-transferase CaiB-like acyl-CoA transferase